MLTELMIMSAERTSRCRYCNKRMRKGSLISGHYGILWGHQICVEIAVGSRSLITSNVDRNQRPLDLAKRTNRFYHLPSRTVRGIPKHQQGAETVSGFVDHMQKTTQKVMASMGVPQEMMGESNSSSGMAAEAERIFSEKLGTVTGRYTSKEPSMRNAVANRRMPVKDPESKCEHHSPQIMMSIHMPPIMRPRYGTMARDKIKFKLDSELLPIKLRDLVEETWEKLKRARFSHYMCSTQEAPICNGHGALDVVEVKDRWKRHYWWVCPWKPEDDEKGMNYNGYELI